ncbi:MAG: carcinine hydrolase/isopenicillin-N N-acyltransferase family protein [Candidatus Cryptobacteroides sp.]
MKKILYSLLALLLAAAGIFIYGGLKMFGDELKAVRSLKMIDEGLYTFTFKGDYGFKAFLEQGGARTDAEMARYIAAFLSHGYMNMPEPEDAAIEAGCTSFQGGGFFSRNFDYEENGQHIVIVRTEPSDGYKSISTSTFAFLGNGPDWHPVAGMDGLVALAAAYIPLDGMNEKGVCVADLIELDGDTEACDTGKPDLTIVGAIRLVLDYAASAGEAVELLDGYDVHPSIGQAHHLAIADADTSLVVEWKGGQMHVTPASVVTNHCLWESRENPVTSESRSRMDRIGGLRPDNSADALDAVRRASYDGFTLWSVVYDRSSLDGTWYVRSRWDRPFEIGLLEP